MVRTQKLGTCLVGKPHWIVGRWWTGIGKDGRFLKGQLSPRSNAFGSAPGTPERWYSWDQVFPGPLERSCGSSCVYLSSRQLRPHSFMHASVHPAIYLRGLLCRNVAGMRKRMTTTRRHSSTNCTARKAETSSVVVWTSLDTCNRSVSWVPIWTCYSIWSLYCYTFYFIFSFMLAFCEWFLSYFSFTLLVTYLSVLMLLVDRHRTGKASGR